MRQSIYKAQRSASLWFGISMKSLSTHRWVFYCLLFTGEKNLALALLAGVNGVRLLVIIKKRILS